MLENFGLERSNAFIMRGIIWLRRAKKIDSRSREVDSPIYKHRQHHKIINHSVKESSHSLCHAWIVGCEKMVE